jgi:hypothetical protein
MWKKMHTYQCSFCNTLENGMNGGFGKQIFVRLKENGLNE